MSAIGRLLHLAKGGYGSVADVRPSRLVIRHASATGLTQHTYHREAVTGRAAA